MADTKRPPLPKGFLTEPVPNDRAIEWIQGKTPMGAGVFEGLLPELKARAIAVAGIEAAGVARDIRKAIAEVPAGADWDKQRRVIADLINPYLAGEGDAAALKARIRKAEILLRTHGSQGYAVAQHEVMREQEDIFPYWQYLSMEDEGVRPAHSALNKLIFPANSPFWHHHSPPWDWGCRCRKVSLLPEEVAEIQNRERKLAPEKQTVIEGKALELVETQNKLNRGPTEVYDITAPADRGKPGAFLFEPDSLRLSAAELQGRYDAQTWREFQEWAHRTEAGPDTTVWEWMGGTKLQAPGAAVQPEPGFPGMGGKKPKEAQTTKAGNVTETLAAQGITLQSHMSLGQASKLVGALQEAKPVLWGSVVKQLNLPASHPVLTTDLVTGAVQDFLNLLPPDLVKRLPKLDLHTVDALDDAAQYFKGGKILFAEHHTTSAEVLRRNIFHELTHWVHLELPDSHSWVRGIQDHFVNRTAGELVVPLAHASDGSVMYSGFRDHWFNAYMGRYYGLPEEAMHLGLEHPTSCLELLAHPAELSKAWNLGYHAREDITLALRILFP
jgi:SPP1 gp7 family putative phage head morphogenesis protein